VGTPLLTGENDHGDLGIDRLELRQRVQTTHAGHVEVEQHDRRGAPAREVQPGSGVRGERHGEPVLGEDLLEGRTGIRVVIDDQDGGGLATVVGLHPSEL
jgi:hypothetical protein